MGIYGNKALYITEASAEDDSMSLSQAEKWYNTLITSCKTHSEKKEDIKDQIKVLKQCQNNMEKELKNAKMRNDTDGRIKYTLKSLIPFNAIYRGFKYTDWLPVIPSILLGPLGDGIVRFITYQNMLEKMIKNSKEAISFLENKLKKM